MDENFNSIELTVSEQGEVKDYDAQEKEEVACSRASGSAAESPGSSRSAHQMGNFFADISEKSARAHAALFPELLEAGVIQHHGETHGRNQGFSLENTAPMTLSQLSFQRITGQRSVGSN